MPWKGKFWHIWWPIDLLRPFMAFYDNLVYFVAIRYIFPLLVHRLNKILAI
jgi:hypothetical protein